jgi:hypothetical protein
MPKVESLFIVGAGFSSCAGLPLAGDFTRALLAVEDLGLGPSKALVPFLRRFVRDAFDHKEGADARFWPVLEDLFTCVDLAANSGHHLGHQCEPARLRTVRRALIVRIIKMLRQHSGPKYRKEKEDDWKQLQRFCRGVDVRKTAFISMNWDTVIEETLLATQDISAVDYGCDARPAEFIKSRVQLRSSLGGRKAQILKLHGSVNWMYCDNCRELFWFPPEQSSRIATCLFSRRDWELVKETTPSDYEGRVVEVLCPCCEARGLGTRLATFSYRKTLEFPMFHKSWLAAERLLREASAWIFIGYSLPGADYEFKYLLKRTQLARGEAPRLVLIAGGDHGKAEETYRNYQRFFGRGIRKSGVKPSYFTSGLVT